MHVSKQVDSSLAERVPAFLENRWKDVDAIAAALDHANYENVRILGYNMQGAGTSYGFNWIAEIGASLEQAARHRESEEIRAQAAELARYLIRLHGGMDS
jgi:hypothetical protein